MHEKFSDTPKVKVKFIRHENHVNRKNDLHLYYICIFKVLGGKKAVAQLVVLTGMDEPLGSLRKWRQED